MAAGAWIVYATAKSEILKGNIDLDLANNLRMVLVTASYTPSAGTHDQWNDISTNEVANGNGYSTHGKVLTATVTAPGSPGLIVFSCDSQSWTTSTITAKYSLIVEDADQNGSLAATDIPICYCDLDTGGGSVSTTNGTFQITIPAGGVFTLE